MPWKLRWLLMLFMLRDMPPEPWPPPPPPPLAKAALADNEATVMAKAATVAVRMDFMVMFVSDPFPGGRSSPPMTATVETPQPTRCDGGHKKCGFGRPLISSSPVARE